jgi:hypothetical protein
MTQRQNKIQGCQPNQNNRFTPSGDGERTEHRRAKTKEKRMERKDRVLRKMLMIKVTHYELKDYGSDGKL